MRVTFEPTDMTGDVYADRDTRTGQARLFLHDPHRPGTYRVRLLAEDEVAALAQQLCDMQAAGPADLGGAA